MARALKKSPAALAQSPLVELPLPAIHITNLGAETRALKDPAALVQLVFQPPLLPAKIRFVQHQPRVVVILPKTQAGHCHGNSPGSISVRDTYKETPGNKAAGVQAGNCHSNKHSVVRDMYGVQGNPFQQSGGNPGWQQPGPNFPQLPGYGQSFGQPSGPGGPTSDPRLIPRSQLAATWNLGKLGTALTSPTP